MKATIHERPAAASVKRKPGVWPALSLSHAPMKPGCACGGDCPRCRGPRPQSSLQSKVQPKLRVGAPDDRYEREAERIAAGLLADSPTAALPSPSSLPAQVKRARKSPAKLATDTTSEEAAHTLGEGRPLDADTRGFFEPRLGHDLSRVRLHTGAQAAESADRFGARAYTLGHNIVFGAGEYAPASSSGRQLLAHELVHVVQQGAGAPRRQKIAASSPPARGPVMSRGAYSVRLITEQGERFIGPELPAAGAIAGGELPPSQTAPAVSPEEDTGENVPLQRMPKSDASTVWIQRTATFTKPTPNPQDPLVRLAQGLTPGLTTPQVNSTLKPSMQQLINDISPTQVKKTGSSGGNVTCAFDNFNLDTTAEQIVASAAPVGGWTGNVPPDKLDNPPQCAKVAQVAVTMNAQPNNADFVKRVQKSEDEHVDDLKVLHDRHFVPYDKFITGLKGSGKDLPACGQNLLGQLNNRHMQAGFAFTYGWMESVRKLDGPGGTHSDTALVKAAASCASATVTLSQTNPTIAGAAPGNVVTVKPTVTTFDPKKLKVQGNDLKDDKTVVKTFSNAADAKAALAVIQHYGMTTRNVIGPMEYFLVGGAAPSGALKGANELAIDPANYQVTLDLPNTDDWAVTDAMGTAKGINVNVIVNFGAKRDEAYSAWAVMTGFGFTVQGWVGGTRQKPEMMYFRV